MKRGIAVLVGCAVLMIGGYFAVSKWAIRHQTYQWYDTARHRVVAVDLAVRRDYEMESEAGYRKFPVAIISHGNTVKYTEYSFIANLMAARGYLVASIQHDLPTDKPLMTVKGDLYVGRLGVYERGERNILFAISQLKKIEPNADYQHLTLIGHSNGGDISMFFAQQHPGMVRRVVTLDNLRVPFVTYDGPSILSFRSDDWKPDPGVVPNASVAKKDGIEIIHTKAQHVEMSDRGPASVKEMIEADISKFLDHDSKLAPADTNHLIVSDPRAMGP